MTTFSFVLDLTQEMVVEQIWPDGDAPEDPTTDDVLAVVNKYGSIASFIREWDMAINACLFIDGKPSELR